MNRTAAPLLNVIRRAFRPSSAVRVLWLGIAVLHGWLLLRRVWLDETSSLLDFARTSLCLAGVVYASMKVWSIAAVVDQAPRRVLAFGLLLVVLHWGVSAPADGIAAAAGTNAPHFPALVLVLPAMTISLCFAAAIVSARRLQPARQLSAAAMLLRLQENRFPHRAEPDAYSLFRRPPPFLG